MSSTTSRPVGDGRTQITDTKTGTVIHTDVSPEFGGGGTTFSSTDLVGAGLGSCISSSLAAIADRHGVPLEAITITVDKELIVAEVNSAVEIRSVPCRATAFDWR